jgi:CubicO group peptidase (beta-lactamase class C family)
MRRAALSGRPAGLVLLIPCLLLATGCTAEHGPPVAAAWEAPAMPDTPQGRQVAAYLEAFNSGNEAALASFVRENATPIGPGGSDLDTRVRSAQGFYNATRGLNVLTVETPAPAEVAIVAQLRLTEQWRRMTFMFDDSSPPRLGGIRIEPADPPAALPKPAAQPLDAALDAYMARQVAADQFCGVVLVARGGKPVFASAYGLADKDRNVPNHVETPFHYASVGKMFTAVAVAQLVDAGRLSFEHTVADYLPEFAGKSAGAVTLRQLLTHQSGILDFFEAKEEFERVQGSDNPQRDYLAVFAEEPLRFPPGEKFEYSNSNFILLGAIVERVSGLPFEKYLDEHIFSPAGMTSTSLNPKGHGEATPACGYTELAENGKMTPGTRRLIDLAQGRGSAAGGGVTTAGDMLKFAEALRTHRLLSAKATEQLLTDQVDGQRPGEHYAMGFITRNNSRDRIVGHSGGFPGVDAQVDMYMGSGWTVVVLANYEGVGEPAARHIESLLDEAP